MFSYPSQHAPLKLSFVKWFLKTNFIPNWIFNNCSILTRFDFVGRRMLCQVEHGTCRRRVPRGLRGWTITWRTNDWCGRCWDPQGHYKLNKSDGILAKVGHQIDFGSCFQPAMICRFKSQVCLSLPVTSGITRSSWRRKPK